MITKEAIEAAARAMCEAWHYSKIGTPDGDAEWARKQDQYRTQARAALTAAFAAMPGPAVKVCELVWSGGNGNYPEWRADGFGFKASIDKSRASLFGEFPLFINGEWDHQKHNTLEASKAAAQADYEARILSALTPAPDLASENERMRAALEDAKQQAANHKRSRAYNDGVNIALENIEASAKAALERT